MASEAPSSRPYVSIVVVSRNDDHGGKLMERLGAFWENVTHFAPRSGLRLEVVLVEWNPPADRPPLADVLPIPAFRDGLDLRIVTVPEAVHRRIPRYFNIPLFQMIGKNVGIRRARADYVLVTCNDLIFTEALYHFLAARVLDPSRTYRLDRFDLPVRELPPLGPQGRLDFCATQTCTVCGARDREGITAITFDGPRHAFLRADPQALRRFANAGLGYPLHTNACGDFTLMARDAWFALRGHNELPLGDVYVDGLVNFAAAALGLRQVYLGDPVRAYHIAHGLNCTIDIEQRRRHRPSLNYALDYVPWCEAILRNSAPMNVNNDDWGLAYEDLPETWLCRAGR